MGCLFLIVALLLFPNYPWLVALCLILAYLTARDGDEWR
jgi:hypothetical protein